MRQEKGASRDRNFVVAVGALGRWEQQEAAVCMWGRWVSREDLGKFKKTNVICHDFYRLALHLWLVYSILDKKGTFSAQFSLREEKRTNSDAYVFLSFFSKKFTMT